jgi:hypothetical protein
MNHLCFTVDANVRLHPEIPLLALARLVHLRIALLVLVLCCAGRIDDGCIHDGTAGHLHPILFQIDIDQTE